jgi:hypothetical protein
MRGRVKIAAANHPLSLFLSCQFFYSHYFSCVRITSGLNYTSRSSGCTWSALRNYVENSSCKFRFELESSASKFILKLGIFRRLHIHQFIFLLIILHQQKILHEQAEKKFSSTSIMMMEVSLLLIEQKQNRQLYM